jgi:dihydroorotase/N-acyl-D-amino-acid deacylase
MRSSRLLPLVLAIVTAWLAVPSGQRPRFDIVIANGRIMDGTGAPWFRGDVGIVGDRITAIGALGDTTASATVDATNLVVAPGFIDLLGQSEFNVLVDGRAASKILQGVTTEVTGEGSSIAPVNDRQIADAAPNAKYFGVAQDWRTLADYFTRLQERSHTTINMATFVGAGGVRSYVIGKDDRPATPAELERMKALVAEAMQQGAIGLSTSLQYVPDRFASTDEIVELAKVAARYGGVYFTHQRSESARIFESLDEVFAIAERASIAAEIWHLKTAYKANFGKMPEVLRRIEAARARGLDVTTSIPTHGPRTV